MGPVLSEQQERTRFSPTSFRKEATRQHEGVGLAVMGVSLHLLKPRGENRTKENTTKRNPTGVQRKGAVSPAMAMVPRLVQGCRGLGC